MGPRKILGFAAAVLLTLVLVLPSGFSTAATRTDSLVYLPLLVMNGAPPAAGPTATMTPKPTTGLAILENRTVFTDSIDYVHIVGEVQNNGSSNLEFVKVIADFFNGTQLVADDITYTHLNTLLPGERTCFEILVSGPLAWTSYQFEAPSFSVTSQSRPALSISGDSGSIDPTFNWYRVLGMERNDGATPLSFAKVVGTLYNAGGDVIGCGLAYANSTSLAAGQSSSFTMTFTGRDYYDATSYRLQTDGTP